MTVPVQRLDALTASRIAAGEVIERPACVVKELIDNALDAEARRIDIELRNGGRRLIQVTDNGSGIQPEDATLVLQRFTTSKIRQFDDLQALTTLGFRGEALPSMAAVAEVELYTRPADRLEGVCVRSRDGSAAVAVPVGCPIGTRVCVHHLFATVPVRLRALKSIAREVQVIQELVGQYALAHPHITFTLRHDGRRLLFLPACTDFNQRLTLVLGRELASHLLPVHGRRVDLRVHGAVSTPLINRASRQRQVFWVNGRPVRSGLLSYAVERGYGALLPGGRHPVVALGVTLPPDLVDVNVHPRKTEIKFLHERAVFAGVQEAVEMAIQRLSVDVVDGQEVGGEAIWGGFSADAMAMEEGVDGYGRRSHGGPTPLLQPLGQVGDTFVVASGAQGLLLIDQHAAHERLLYDALMASGIPAVELEEPFVLYLTALQRRWLERVQPVLASTGFTLEPFGKEAMLVCAVPQALQGVLRAHACLEALQEAQQRVTAEASPEAVKEHLGAALACRTAYRAGDVLSAEQLHELVLALAQQRLAYTCPHGRPTYVSLTLAELERRFLRLFSP